MRPRAIPAMVSAHSHAFQVALRGRGERPSSVEHHHDDFWSWREGMFELAATMDPDAMGAAGDRVYAEMAAAGYGAVGEFHYVHHRGDGTPYGEPNATAIALAEAAQRQGLTIVLLPVAYHRAGPGRSATPGQAPFCDPDVETFLTRVDALRRWADGRPGVHVGVGAHSVRAVPADWLAAIAVYSERHGLVRHVHAHEQPRELAECRGEHGCSPIRLLDRTGFLGPRATVVHGVHVDDADIALLAGRRATIVSCPTTEGNLGDGIFPAARWRDAEVPIAVGTDANVRLDPFEEVRELETLARRAALSRRGLLMDDPQLWFTVAAAGARSLGLPDAGTIEIDRDHPQLIGVAEEDLPLALATCVSSAVVLAR